MEWGSRFVPCKYVQRRIRFLEPIAARIRKPSEQEGQVSYPPFSYLSQDVVLPSYNQHRSVGVFVRHRFEDRVSLKELRRFYLQRTLAMGAHLQGGFRHTSVPSFWLSFSQRSSSDMPPPFVSCRKQSASALRVVCDVLQ